MNNQDKIAEQKIRELLQLSQLKINSPVFTDQLMLKIETKTSIEFGFRKYLRLSWFFIILSALFLPLSIDMVISNFNNYFPYFELYFPINLHNLMLIIIISMVLVIIFQIDRLINMTLRSKTHSL